MYWEWDKLGPMECCEPGVIYDSEDDGICPPGIPVCVDDFDD